jgi:CheY-like chemotaxis protein/HPt (histidine-containing phosphotransfer) domain-containing protein
MTLTVALPIADPAALRPLGPASGPGSTLATVLGRRPAPSPAEAEAEGTLVLVADDHPTNRALLERQLRALGYAAEAAEHGVDALARWRTGRFALVLTDCHMPEMDGYDLARAIRRDEAARDGARVPIIACTANALAGEAEVCRAAGMDDYLAKPVEMTALARVLDRWLPLPAPGAAGPAAAGAPLGPQDTAAPAARADGGPAPLDPAALAALTGGDATIERDILLEFKHANDADADALATALAARDLPGIVRAAHRIKGASRMVGAQPLADVCAVIEDAGRHDDLPGVLAEEPRLRDALDQLSAHLDGLGVGA